MPREKDKDRVPAISARVKQAIAFLIEQKADLQAAAAHAGMTTAELRRQTGKPHVRRYMLAQRQAAIERFCLGSVATLSSVVEGDNQMAKVAAVKTAEILRTGAIEDEARAERRQPGLTIVIVERGGEHIAYQPPPMPVLDVTPAREAEPAIPAED